MGVVIHWAAIGWRLGGNFVAYVWRMGDVRDLGKVKFSLNLTGLDSFWGSC